MTDNAANTGRIGTINGERMTFASSSLDRHNGVVSISVVQRGSRTIERLQAAMTDARMEIQLPDSTEVLQTSPQSIDIATSGAGERALHRVRLMLRLVDDTAEESTLTAVQPGNDGRAANDASSPEGSLDRIEQKLDRVIELLEGQTKTPPDA